MGKLTRWKELFPENIIKSSQQYIEKDAVTDVTDNGSLIKGVVKGMEEFNVEIEYSAGQIKVLRCSCPFAKEGQRCKHMAAVLLAADAMSKDEEEASGYAADEKTSDNAGNTADSLEKADDVIENAAEAKAVTAEATEAGRAAAAKANKTDAVGEGTNTNGMPIQFEDAESQPSNSSNEANAQTDSLDTTEEIINDIPAPVINWPYNPVHEGKIEIKADISPEFTYSLYQNKVPLIRKFLIKNVSDEDFKNLVVHIYSDVSLIEHYEMPIEYLSAGEEKTFRRPELFVQGGFLASLTERMVGNIYVCVTYGPDEYAREGREINIHAFNQWPGLKYDPDLIAAYITPNHPAVVSILHGVAEFLEKNTQNPSLNAYQSEEPDRVLAMANAAFAAIQKKNIIYAEPPANFAIAGQRIRLADEIIETKLGTCLDLTLLYAGVLEAMGLHPILIWVEGHIFAGVWLIKNYFPEPYFTDVTLLEKAIGLGEIVPVECTLMCAGKNVSFDDAIKSANETISKHDEFQGVSDVFRTRLSEVLPLPSKVLKDGKYVLEHHERKDKDVTSLTDAKTKTYDFSNMNTEDVTKQVQWERKLLDLSTRNSLINMRPSGVISLLSFDISSLEDSLSENIEFEIYPRPKEWDIHNITTATFEELNNLGPYEELIAQEAKKHRLHAWIGDTLEKELTKLYRNAKKSMEENGASTLYLALGLLRWIDTAKSKSHPYYAPVVLIPVDIIKKSATKGYVIRERDDDVQINVTILEYIKQNYGIDIPGLSPIPKDEHGVDIDQIFAIIRHELKNREGWDVIENVNLGNFSFTQFVMWNDLKAHPDMLERSKVVRGLINGVEEWDQYVDRGEDMPYLPVSVDESQLRAINMAANDISFVLHGPPGTGKSQTITAMIANALAKGKTVLFVAEKMAALEVVQRRLESLGIGDFCLELHSHTAVKKNVLEKLKKVVDIGVLGMKSDYDEKIAELSEIRAKLDGYARALHKKRSFGISVRDMIDEYESIPEQKTVLRPDEETVKNITIKDFEKNILLLERLVVAGKAVGHPHGHMFGDIKRTEYTKSLRIDLEEACAEYEKAAGALCEYSEDYSGYLGVNNPVGYNDWNALFELADSIIKLSKAPEWLMQNDAISQAENALNGFLAKKDTYLSNKDNFLKSFDESILDIDLNIFVTKYAEAEKKIFGKAKAIENVSKELEAYTKFEVKQEFLPKMSSDVATYKGILGEYNTALQAIPEHLKEYATEGLSAEKIAELKKEWTEKIAVKESDKTKIFELKSNGKFEEALNLTNKFNEIKGKYTECCGKLEEILSMSLPNDETDWMAKRKELTDMLCDNYSALRDWITYREVRAECINEGLSDICKLYTDGLEHDAVIPVYRKSMLRALIWDVITNEPSLNKFTGTNFNETIREYRKMEEEFVDTTKQEIYYKLTHNIPVGYSDADSIREMGILRKAITSGGRGQSIRSLFDQIPHVLTRLCPCLLMSPISVSQYLSADNTPFDVVIFDEASQLPTCKAVGVLARGNNAVIVGDPNQMPPTSFFAGNMVDEDNLDIEDLESILDDCLALGMPSAHLQWHYRSRHESLISFSNREYYENSMLTFPSVNDREKRVKLCTVNGTFNRKKGRVNEEEAAAIIKEVKRRYNSPLLRDYSLGIVTFNEKQQSLILDLLQEEYKKDPELEKWAELERDTEDRLFVKNLENVQGDERDVILFSVTYGPDEDGKLSLNFGPLNREGGWKRLNVAVSRSRMEMILFSSMTSDMIDLNRTKSRGVEGLKDFLAFAEKGTLIGESYGGNRKITGIAGQICDALEKEGYSVQTNVGHSDFKIDIAVINPFDENEYLLGIMLDGATYNRSKNTRDREISQTGVLGGLGWKLHRIWTMDWWDNKEQEIKNLTELLSEIKEEARVASENPKAKDEGPESEEIIPLAEREKKPVEKKTRKKKEAGEISSFEDSERFKARPVIKVIENGTYKKNGVICFRDYEGNFTAEKKKDFLNDYCFYLGKKGSDSHEDYVLLVSKEAADILKEGVSKEGKLYYSSLLPNVNQKDLFDSLDMLAKEGDKIKKFKDIVDVIPEKE